MKTDFIVIGAGMAGASAAHELAKLGTVALLEREERAGYHTTGRSAAMLMGGYGEPEFMALTHLSEPFLRAPPPEFTDTPLLRKRGCLYVGASEEARLVAKLAAEMLDVKADITLVDADWIVDRVPIMRRDLLSAGVWEAAASEVDVHALHEGYLRGFRRAGGTLVTGCNILALERNGSVWRVKTTEGTFDAPVVVNAAGAWADTVAVEMGAQPKQITPMRRTVVLVDPPPGIEIGQWPLVIHVAESYYFKPDAGKILISPADKTPMPPCDVQPDEIDVAVAIDRLEQVTTLKVGRVTHRWAGLRSFAPDRKPVVGFDPDVEGLFWLAGQGGSGIMTAPALARVTGALLSKNPWPSQFSDAGLSPDALSPRRFADAKR
jgi:D-arginine dehydrogenase